MYFAKFIQIGKTWTIFVDKDVDDEMWITIFQVNAFYDPTSNGIEFPAGILAAPIYDRRAPMYMNYGAIGMVIGHEMSHGFDITGESNPSLNCDKFRRSVSRRNGRGEGIKV